MIERVLIVGLGSIGKRHVRLIRELIPNVQIIVLRHKSCQNLSGVDIDNCVTNLTDALAFQPQAAIIANPASYHIDVALSLAKAGVHLLIEKPISNTSQGVLELIEICRSQDVTLMTAYNLRFLPSLQYFRELIMNRHMGQAISVRAEIGQYLPSWRPDTDYRQTVSAKAALGGGVLLELSHEFDYLRWLFGEVEWVSANCLKQSDLQIDVEDTVHVLLGFTQRSGKSKLVASLNMDFVRHDTTRICTVIGKKGSLRWNALLGTVEYFEQDSKSWEVLYEHQHQRDDSYRAEWKHFLACINEDRTPEITGHDGLAVLKIIEAAHYSSVNKTSEVKISKDKSGVSK